MDVKPPISRPYKGAYWIKKFGGMPQGIVVFATGEGGEYESMLDVPMVTVPYENVCNMDDRWLRKDVMKWLDENVGRRRGDDILACWDFMESTSEGARFRFMDANKASLFKLVWG